MSIKNIIICTTAINRPKLHSQIFPKWIEWLDELDRRNYKLIWFINIDVVSELDHTFIETRDNIKRIVNGRIDVRFLHDESIKGSHYNACKRISDSVDQACKILNPDKIRLVWLEDDWELNDKACIPLETLLINYSSNMSHINLTFIRNNYVWALAPSVISYKLWLKVFHKAWHTRETGDPEHIAGKFWVKYNGKEKNYHNLTIISRTVTEKYMKRPYFHYSNSKFTVTDPSMLNYDFAKYKGYVTQDKIKETFGNTIVFIRITPTFCKDLGRSYMKENNLKKEKNSAQHYAPLDDKVTS